MSNDSLGDVSKPYAWRVKKYVIEEYEVVAKTREEAEEIELIDPGVVTVIKTTFKRGIEWIYAY